MVQQDIKKEAIAEIKYLITRMCETYVVDNDCSNQYFVINGMSNYECLSYCEDTTIKEFKIAFNDVCNQVGINITCNLDDFA